MLAKVRRRTALYQIAVIAAVLVAVFAFIGVYNYDRMTTDIDQRLAVIRGYGDFPFAEKRPDDKLGGRDYVVIRVYKSGLYKVSDPTFYDEETVIKIIAHTKEGTGKTSVNGKRIAYAAVNNGGDSFYTVYVYDYSALYNAYVLNVVTWLLTGVAVLVVVAFFVFRFTNRNLKPIEDAMNKQQELVANASHELKTPLTIINTDLSVLLSGGDELTAEQKKWLGGIQTQVNRMSAMINEMLVLARFEAVRKNKEVQKVDLSSVVESVTLETEALAFEKNVAFETFIAPGVIVNASPDELEKLVYIFVDNAMKYTQSGGKITVRLTKERRRATLRVKNTGEGIPADRLPKLFDRFYRVEESHTESGSFGLGLSIAKAIVDSIGATVGVNSKQGEYTEFVVVFREAIG